jgi:hypothetical protein
LINPKVGGGTNFNEAFCNQQGSVSKVSKRFGFETFVVLLLGIGLEEEGVLSVVKVILEKNKISFSNHSKRKIQLRNTYN